MLIDSTQLTGSVQLEIQVTMETIYSMMQPLSMTLLLSMMTITLL
jgi:hypothetical protein